MASPSAPPRRLIVAITGASFAPDNPAWASAFARLQERGRVVFSAAIDGAVYAKHGTTIDTRLTVIDKLPADDPAVFPTAIGVAPDVATLMGWLADQLPARLPVDPGVAVPIARPAVPRTVRGYVNRTARAAPAAPHGHRPRPRCRRPARKGGRGMTALLEVNGVSKTFDGFRAINNLSFNIADAELRAGKVQRLLESLQRFTADSQLFLIRRQREPRGGDFRDQADAGRALRLLAGEHLLLRGAGQGEGVPVGELTKLVQKIYDTTASGEFHLKTDDLEINLTKKGEQ